MRIKMHSLEEVGGNVPAFLAKLWKIVEDPETNDLIHWSAEGASFIIQNTAQFSRELLPLYYKHNNMASFIRQLNMYGFHKVVSLEAGGLKVDKDEMEFAHPCFVNGHPYLLENIKRKQIPNKLVGELRPGSRSDVYGKVLTEVKNMKGRQESLNSQLVAMKRENEVLWREVALLREKHKQQQTIVNKLVHFFVNLFQADEAGKLRLKRQARLMIKDKAHNAAKVAKLDPDLMHNYSREDCSPEGPIIHEIDASDLLNDYSTSQLSEEEASLLPHDLCEVVESGDVQSPTSPPRPSSQRLEEDSNPGDILLDVCPDIMVSPAPLDISTVVAESTDVKPSTTPKVSSGVRSREVKRRRRRRSTGTRALPTCLTTQRGNELTIILPLDEAVDDPEPVELIVPELVQTEEPSSLETATSAAIQAISDVAASTTTSGKDASTVTSTATTTAIAPRTSTTDTDANSTTTALDRWGVMDQLDNHVGSMQCELDNIRELLKSEGYSLDDSTLLGVRPAHQGLEADVFTKIFSDEPLSYELPELTSGTDSIDDKNKENVELSSDPMIDSGEPMSCGSNGLPEFIDFLDWSQVSDAPNDYEMILGDLSTPQMVPSSPGVSK